MAKIVITIKGEALDSPTTPVVPANLLLLVSRDSTVQEQMATNRCIVSNDATMGITDLRVNARATGGILCNNRKIEDE